MHAGTAEPSRVSPPEAVAYLLELKKMLEVRVADGSLLRLIGTCLHVGVLDGETIVEPELGTAQGSGLSPLLGNVYLHDVLDLWFEGIQIKNLNTWCIKKKGWMRPF